jgi:glucosamine-6-phosphate deaminase
MGEKKDKKPFRLTPFQDEYFRKYEKIPTVIFDTAKDASKGIAREIADFIWSKNGNCVLGLPTGSTPIFVYEELIRLHKSEGLSFQKVHTFNLDEYYPIKHDTLQSYVRYMNENFFDHIDIPKDQINIPDGSLPIGKVPAFCEHYEQKIQKLGGIDIQMLGIGRTGHIGFNEPGSSFDSRTRLITLDWITRMDAASDFFGEEYVPRRAITMGIGTIFSSRRIFLLAWGEGKSGIVKNSVEDPVNEHVPASFLQKHPNTIFVLDEASASGLIRRKTPWLIGHCEWEDRMIRKGVVWLCQKVSKPILKLTDRDYNDNGMSDLIAKNGPSSKINIKVFNELQQTITGWPGGKPNADDSNRPERARPFPKRVIIFSPHPDDDVISMGGTFIRLFDQGHEVHVAYQTSGNIAVFDEDVIRFTDFVVEYLEAFGKNNEAYIEQYRRIQAFVKSKQPGQVDSPEVKEIKGLIRKTEARAGCRFVGIPDKNIHYLNLPFYETGTVKKNPIGKADIEITKSLITEIKPHQIYAAGDLSDPHGTHRVCLEAVLKAVKSLKSEKWMEDCWLWLYRGAWQEWEIENVEMAVPLSPDELTKKTRAIFKHQSQKDSALFPGTDEREFWERAQDRNKATAHLYNKLGMAEYEAMEAFVRYQF